MAKELHLELLLGKQVRDAKGNSIGRIEEIRAEPQGDEWVIHEYLIGVAAIVERLSARTIGLGVLHLLSARNIHEGFCMTWDKLDLTDPDHPRLTCTIEQLKSLSNTD